MAESWVDRTAAAFVACTLPVGEWTHHAHLRVGLWHLLRHPPAEALDLLRERIRRYNASIGIPNTEKSGYHETITAFYVRLIQGFLAEADRTAPPDELARELVWRYGDRELPAQYWTNERLMSPAARAAWVEPDVQPLDF